MLRYRLGSHGYRHPMPLLDAARAMRLLRHRALALGIDSRRIGVMGSSAGGHLAATMLTDGDEAIPPHPDAIDNEPCRPDLAVLCYPVVSLGDGGHANSRHMLLGPAPDPDLVRRLSFAGRDLQGWPPCFLWHCADDDEVASGQSEKLAEALRHQGRTIEFRLDKNGGHGQGLGGSQNPLPWTFHLARWLTRHGF